MVNLEEVAKWISILGVILAFIFKIGKPINHMVSDLKKHLSKAEADELGLRSLLKYRLIVLSRKVIATEEITMFERAILEDSLKAYIALGGNGETSIIVHEALKAKVVKDRIVHDLTVAVTKAALATPTVSDSDISKEE